MTFAIDFDILSDNPRKIFKPTSLFMPSNLQCGALLNYLPKWKKRKNINDKNFDFVRPGDITNFYCSGFEILDNLLTIFVKCEQRKGVRCNKL